ncbi:DUF1134 domain-containing protein [Tsuneonella sp. HG222]
MSIIAALRRLATFATLAPLALAAAPLAAQSIETIDPDAVAIDGDLAQPQDAPLPAPSYTDRALNLPPEGAPPAPADAAPVVTSADPSTAATQAASEPGVAAAQGDTYKQDDLIGAAEGVFGKGAEGIARMIEDLLKNQGEPNGYIVGREAGAALGLGVRYGSGTLYHKVEGQKPVYWTGPSIGFDIGANAANTFVLVYNLYDTEELYERYPAGSGDAYLLGGLTASYLRKGDVVLIPIRLGAGVRLGVNAGYMRFSKKQRWLPL